ncbi:MAG: recombination protein O N-terminal domain-containing protein [Treponema sp.]|jgi:DNA repair protein RecO (recombination protein O)|nr:recombination protein O N-terminal domain-containing protein [Treponema sp.]
MSRTAAYSALVLRSRPSGESNSEVFLLTAEEGLIKATVFGGPKSKLRAFASPYNSGQVWIYRDKAKDYAKLSDFDVRSWRPGLREMYERSMAAAAISDTILSSHGGGGEWAAAIKLAAETLDTLENASEELSGRLLVYFLWRWAGFLGIQPFIDCCSVCDRGDETLLWFNAHEGAVLCANCLGTESALSSGFLKLNPGCRKWLSVAGEQEPSCLYRYSMDNKSFYEAKTLTTAILTGVIGKKLSSWEY